MEPALLMMMAILRDSSPAFPYSAATTSWYVQWCVSWDTLWECGAQLNGQLERMEVQPPHHGVSAWDTLWERPAAATNPDPCSPAATLT